ncbi:YcfL family protein [Shewanella sp.]|uniref:YcfL family protein n=1 Tax=Shewanella sp. TaxID=50422 RepID=UPI003569443D
MKKGMTLMLAAVLAMGVAGCAKHTAGVSVASSGESRVDNATFSREVSVSDVRLIGSGDLLKGSALISSKVSTDLRLQYKFSWYDAQGLLVEAEGQSWQSLKLHGMQQQQVSSVAPNSSASRVEIYVRKAFSN